MSALQARRDLDRNWRTYDSPSVVAHYLALGGLQPPEDAILDLLRPLLPGMRMLDIGVGTGRTTPHFQALVREYTAIDYSPKMIEACKRRFPHIQGVFRVGDARAMTEFSTAAFDLVLFSFNGIDVVSHEDRMRELREIGRVLSPGGSLVFSSHNIRSLKLMYQVGLSGGPKTVAKHLVRAAGVRLRNGLTPATGRYARIYDGAHRFRLRQYYATPEEQLRQLTDAGFADARIFSLEGQPVDRAMLPSVTDSWLYYLCIA